MRHNGHASLISLESLFPTKYSVWWMVNETDGASASESKLYANMLRWLRQGKHSSSAHSCCSGPLAGAQTAAARRSENPIPQTVVLRQGNAVTAALLELFHAFAAQEAERGRADGRRLVVDPTPLREALAAHKAAAFGIGVSQGYVGTTVCHCRKA